MDDLNTSTSVLLFGSQADSIGEEVLEQIRTLLREGRSQRWVLETVAGLRRYFDAYCEEVPKIAQTIRSQSRAALSDFESWLRSGSGNGVSSNELLRSGELPSIVLSPMIVLVQLVQYRQYLRGQKGAGDSANAPSDSHAHLVAQKKAAALGFCIGLLPAYAVASAKDSNELARHGAAAVSLAMLGGAMVDAQDEWNAQHLGYGPSRSFAIAWRNDKQRMEMQRIVKELFPEAYIAVLYDKDRATLTTTQRVSSKLLRRLHTAGITIARLGYTGDIHSPRAESKTDVESLINFCNRFPEIQLPSAAGLAMESYTNAGSDRSVDPTAGGLHQIALRAALAEQCDWYGTFAAVKTRRLEDDESTVVTFGPDRCAPPTLARSLGSRAVHFADLPQESISSDSDLDIEQQEQQEAQLNGGGDGGAKQSASQVTDDMVAVVGMSIKVAGAEDLHEFSKMLRTGESQHQEIKADRMVFESLFPGNESSSRTYYANLMDNVDAFDHRFFKKSPRESASMDPQHRLFLQAAYQAVAQSGYFTTQSRHAESGTLRQKHHVGVYVGVPAMDYEHNVACHPVNSFTALGNVSAALAGRVASHFGWTGSAITLDTACSSSAVAIHMACRNLLSGECNAALAGGVTVFTNPHWFENLAAADFLSPTGPCKPFDDRADGYCRGEGISCVFLKRAADAHADGDSILGYIASSAVYQNDSSTPMFVPNSQSLSTLFEDVISNANISPAEISLVEAHGTGTRVGDPAEYSAIRSVLGGPTVRSNILPFGSLKGHIGHTEGASGAASLIKVLLMMHENFIPAQAGFLSLSSAINASPSDRMEVVTATRTWSDDQDPKWTLINNYGASGSNAALVVAQPSPASTQHVYPNDKTRLENDAVKDDPRLPFCLTGLDMRSVMAFAAKLAAFIEAHPSTTLPDLSFNVDRQANPSLAIRACFSSNSTADLVDKLWRLSSLGEPDGTNLDVTKAERPVIMCFGGQTTRYVGLDRKVYDNAAILRSHLEKCDAVVQSLGQSSIFPRIFSDTLIEDPVELQTTLFAMQYACAQTWLSCGLSGRIAAVVGHSFGELTALCVSGALTLEDAIRVVILRARHVRDSWGSDKGTMMVVDADETLVRSLLHDANEAVGAIAGEDDAGIACYNGPHSFTLGGSSKAIEKILDLVTHEHKYSNARGKRLKVSNAFHSSLVEPLVEGLTNACATISFREPSIPIEHATEHRNTKPLTAAFVAEHMRKPVYFSHAIQRLSQDYSSAIFLEAGSSSTITAMARNALKSQSHSGIGSSHFQAVNIIGDGGGLSSLSDTVTTLITEGLNVCFWPHHAIQTGSYPMLILPPYQFEKSSHWLGRKSVTEKVAELVQHQSESMNGAGVKARSGAKNNDEQTWSFVGYDQVQSGYTRPRFQINTVSPRYEKFVSGHFVAQTAPACSATLQMDLAIECFLSLHPDWAASGQCPVLTNMLNLAPICMDSSREIWLTFMSSDEGKSTSVWEITSTASEDTTRSEVLSHSSGELHMRSSLDSTYMAEFGRYERLVPHMNCEAIFESAGDDNVDQEVLQGRSIYRAFTEFVDYSEVFRNVNALVAKGDECVGRVKARYSATTWLDVVLDDSFCQVPGIWINCMSDLEPGQMCVASGVELMMRSPKKILHASQGPEIWDVYARRTGSKKKGYIVDVFVFHGASGELVEILCGVKFSPVPMVALRKILSELTTDSLPLDNEKTRIQASPAHHNPIIINGSLSGTDWTPGGSHKGISSPTPSIRSLHDPTKTFDMTREAQKVVATVSGLKIEDIGLDMSFEDFGIDSLLAMELRREIKSHFGVDVTVKGLLEAVNSRGLAALLSIKLDSLTQNLKS